MLADPDTTNNLHKKPLLIKYFLPELQEFMDRYAEEHRWLPLVSIPDITTHHFNLQSPFATVASMQALIKAHTTFAASNFHSEAKQQKTSVEGSEVPPEA